MSSGGGGGGAVCLVVSPNYSTFKTSRIHRTVSGTGYGIECSHYAIFDEMSTSFLLSFSNFVSKCPRVTFTVTVLNLVTDALKSSVRKK